MERYVCIHGHFYQPPREDPWLERIEPQESAHPFHDWNERIAAECYAPNAASPLLNGDNQTIATVNNYAKISFNFGPTLLSWMERHRADVYRAVLKADRRSRQAHGGHGSAIAQVYNHMIMPLAGARDKATQVRWAVEDFRKRFQRDPEGMWLPETAVDLDTLEALAKAGIRFTILAPHQALRVKEIGRGEWRDASGGRIDTGAVYLCCLPSGRSIHLFFYNGLIAADVAFGGLLHSGDLFARRLLGAFGRENGRPEIVHIATDGETYGHHRRYGDMALAACLTSIEASGAARLTNYGEYLATHPATHAVEIVENSSWSCAHGVERWRNDCGCRTGAYPGWSQGWRKPLREAMDWLRDRLAALYEEEAALHLGDPWKARDDYIEVILDPSAASAGRFLKGHVAGRPNDGEKKKIFKLLEMQRYAMLIYTSCGWFFDDIAGLEGTQVMRYAARAMELAREINGTDLEPDYLRILEKAPSNTLGSGAKVYELLVKPAGRSRRRGDGPLP